MPEELNKRSVWLGIWERVVTGLVFFAIAAAWIGSTRQKVNQKVTTLEADMAAWKEEWKAEHKHIVTMDLEGSVATKNFVNQYDKEQAKQNEVIRKIQDDVAHLETMKYRIERLEQEVKKP